MDLSTTYLGLKLRTPLVPSASPLSEDLDNIRRMEDCGASAIVLHSLFEEQIRYEHYESCRPRGHARENYPEAFNYFAGRASFQRGPEAYLEHIAKARQSVAIPIIASLNGSTLGGWTDYARRIQEAGAAALELNIYRVPTELSQGAWEIEQAYIDIVKAVREQVTLPLAVKLSPFFTNLGNVASRLDQAGANALVLFNRFYQPDVDLETREVTPRILYSTPATLRLPLRWIAILYERIGASLAATGGVHHGTDVLKMVMAGASVTMVCSALLRRGIKYLTLMEREVREWLQEHDCRSLGELRGVLSQKNCAEPSAFERAHYMRAITGREFRPDG